MRDHGGMKCHRLTLTSPPTRFQQVCMHFSESNNSNYSVGQFNKLIKYYFEVIATGLFLNEMCKQKSKCGNTHPQGRGAATTVGVLPYVERIKTCCKHQEEKRCLNSGYTIPCHLNYFTYKAHKKKIPTNILY